MTKCDLKKLVLTHLGLSIIIYNYFGAEGYAKFNFILNNYHCIINSTKIREANRSQYQANKIGLELFGLIDYQKQTSLGFKPSEAFLIIHIYYLSK